MLLKIQDVYLDITNIRFISETVLENIGQGKLRHTFAVNVGGSKFLLHYKEKENADKVRELLAWNAGKDISYNGVFIELQDKLKDLEDKENVI